MPITYIWYFHFNFFEDFNYFNLIYFKKSIQKTYYFVKLVKASVIFDLIPIFIKMEMKIKKSKFYVNILLFIL